MNRRPPAAGTAWPDSASEALASIISAARDGGPPDAATALASLTAAGETPG